MTILLPGHLGVDRLAAAGARSCRGRRPRLASTMRPHETGNDVGAERPVRLAAPSARGVVRLIAIVVGCAFAIYLAWRLRDVLRVVAIALFVALALVPVVDALDRRLRAIPRAAVILALYVALA